MYRFLSVNLSECSHAPFVLMVNHAQHVHHLPVVSISFKSLTMFIFILAPMT